jgi:hypothetical protein
MARLKFVLGERKLAAQRAERVSRGLPPQKMMSERKFKRYQHRKKLGKPGKPVGKAQRKLGRGKMIAWDRKPRDIPTVPDSIRFYKSLEV